MQKNIHSESTPLVQINLGADKWALGRKDTRQTYCLLSWNDQNLMDVYDTGELERVTIDGKDIQIKFGSHFVS